MLHLWLLFRPLGAAGAPAAIVAGVGQAAEQPKVGSCWTSGFRFEDCCGPEFDPGGNPECWDEVYTDEVCCGEGGDPAERGCNSAYFVRFRRLVAEYYDTERARPALIMLFPKLIANFNARFELCAPAALQASLLHMEERVALESVALTADRLAGHALRLQQGFATGLLKAEDLRQWPLEAGLQRVRAGSGSKSRRLAQRPRPPSVALVLSYCRENLSWLNSTLTQFVIRGVHLVIITKCRPVDARSAVPHRRLWRSVDYVDVEDLPLRADECSAYLGYLSQTYYQLHDYTVFVHADAPEHIGSIDRPNIMEDTLRAALNGVHVPFAHLGGNRVTMAWRPQTMTPLYKGIFGSSIAPSSSAVRTYCCSHFVVARERIQLRSQSFYQEALDFITSPRSYSYLPTAKPHALQSDMDGRLVCQNMMFLWHIIFGEDLDQPHRMFDPRMPLFLKLRNLRTAYMDL